MQKTPEGQHGLAVDQIHKVVVREIKHAAQQAGEQGLVAQSLLLFGIHAWGHLVQPGLKST
ncbi:hypothetical protein DF183_14315 [Alcaligenes faecalis]|uniref:Uncharacterized protein n=1 Tax=Alcaligenes faecalis TaxID=511 RepID=A0A2U2BG65_ALCFA|nr:hypothetical protein D7S43_17455 [Alcaligenes faecalis]PWE13008.1 hypothetical protein DF183_14315 [Alcaligenes faecalis]